MKLRLSGLAICLASITALPAVGQTQETWAKAEALVGTHADLHRAALMCYGHDTPDYDQTLTDWELRFRATLRLLQRNGYSDEASLRLRGDYGPAAIFPSRLYSKAELKEGCKSMQVQFKQFENREFTSLLTSVRRLLQQASK